MYLFAATCYLVPSVEAASCWRVTGWSSTQYTGAQAQLVPALCTRIPQNDGWLEVDFNYGTAPTDTIFLQLPLQVAMPS